MKKKTSITISDDVLREVDRLAGSGDRSAFIERALRAYLRRKRKGERYRLEVERLNRAAEALEVEATDVLAYQAQWQDDREAR